MAKDLTLKLETPIEQLIPAMIAWNNTELLNTVKEGLAEYKGKIYDENSISDAKTDRASLNKFITALNSERIRIKKVYTEPLDKFTGEVNEVITAVEDVVEEIDVQVKGYEKRKKEEKYAECVGYFNTVIPEEIKNFVPYTKIHKEEWLNSSKALSGVKKEIDATIEKIKSELQTLETLGGDIDELKYLYFERLNLAETITTHERKKAEKQRIEQARLEADRKVAEQIKTDNEQKPIENCSTRVDEPELITRVFKATGTAEQLNALRAFATEHHIKFERA